MILVFDMDDTLYDEITFVKSGFRAVSKYLQEEFGILENDSYELMFKELETNGRGRVFNVVLEKYGIATKKNIKKCLTVYRSHNPMIHLNTDAIHCLERFKNSPLYIVTDGHKLVQEKKAVSLGLHSKVKKVFITYRYGRKHSKPSPYCFMKIAALEKTATENIVYIGDNPHKDFIGIKPLGFKTIRILTGEHKNVLASPAQAAHITISSLDEITLELLEKIKHL